jgi:hypothetical protein
LHPRFLCPSSPPAGGLRAAILRTASSFSVSLRGLKLLRLEHAGVSLDDAPAVREFMPG